MYIKTDMKGITRRGNSYRLTVSCGFDGNGKQVRRYSTFKVPEDMPAEKADKMAMRAYEEFYKKCNNLNDGNENMFFKELVERYFEEYASHELKQTTIEHYKSNLNNHILPVFANKRLKDIKKKDVQSFLCNQPKLKGSSCRKLKIVFSSIFSFAVEEGIVAVNPCSSARYKKDTYDKTKFKFLRKKEAMKLLEVTKEYSQLNVIIRILLLTGMRIGELLSLEAQNLDMEHKIIRVQNTLSYANKEKFLSSPKTDNSERILKVNQAIIDMIQEHLEHQKELKKIVGKAWENPTLIFTTPTGGFCDRTTINKQFGKLLEKNNLPSITLHGLRHTNATLLIFLGHDVKSVSASLGHSQTQITNDTYVHMFEEYSARMSDSLCDDLL